MRYINFFIPHTKTNANGANIYMSNWTCDCSPTIAFKHHLASNTNIPPSAPLFMLETSDGSWAPMKRAWFLGRCNKVWEQEKLISVKGHGFHISSTTHLLLLGIDPGVVMAQGRWSSQLFLLYCRQCEDILALFIRFSFQTHESILTTMSSFKAKLTGKTK